MLIKESKFIAKFLIGFGFVMLLLSVLCVIFSMFSSDLMVGIVSLFGLLNSAIAIGVGEILKKLNNMD
ncbi:MAG: hypothetical protein LPK26_14065 [Bacillaceae bacterium]|nr:hypothetical protein [Bacillaceae bacterium]